MYYRVATQVDEAPTWQWKSTVLSSLDTLFQFLRLLRALPQDQLRVFSSTSREALAEQLGQENRGLPSHSVTAAQFLCERMLCLPMTSKTSAREAGTSLERRTVAVINQQAANDRGGVGSRFIAEPQFTADNSLERRREELESGSGGDHDVPYNFSLPLSLPQVSAWMTLLARAQRGELYS